MQQFDVVVIGAGSGGLTTAVGLANIGKRVLLVEREHMGGECTNSGCIPSKVLLHHAKTYAAAVAISGANGPSEDYRRQAFTTVRNTIAQILSEETPAHFEKRGMTVVMGEAIFTGPKTITVEGTAYQFKKAVIATGSSPRQTTIPGLNRADILTNQNLFTLADVPKRTLIIGGGPIGMEMGQAFALLGSAVTIIDTGSALGKLEDPAVAAVIAGQFKKNGITFLGNAIVTHVENKIATIVQPDSGTPVLVPFDKVLVAIGRIPNIPTGLAAASINHTEFGISVNRKYQTSNRRVFSLGDVADRLKFTHQADDIARQVVTTIATIGLVGIKTKAVPKVTYTSPELAQVGLSQIDAEYQYGSQNIHRIEVPFTANDRAKTDHATEGVLVVIVTRLSGKILGAHCAAERAGELIAIFTLAIDNNLSLWKIRRSIYAYPTYAGVIKKAGDYFFAAQIKTLRADLTQVVTKILPKLILGLVWLIGLIALYRYQTTGGHTVASSALALFTFITTTGWGPVLYILAYAIRPLTFIPGTAMTVLSGVFFGLWGGIIYTLIGANISATVAYFTGRFFVGNKMADTGSWLGRFAAACRTKPFITVLTMRLIFLPYDGVNYGSGFLRIPYLPYITATILGTILGIITFVAIGASISVENFRQNGISADAINPLFLVLSFAIFSISLGMARFLK